MRVLFDQSTPVPIRPFLQGHSVRTAAQEGWDKLRNGDLFVTPDKNMRYQQNLEGRKIAIVVIGTPQWPALRAHVERVVAAVNAVTSGSYVEVEIPHE